MSVAELDALCTAFLKLPGMYERSTRDLYIDVLNTSQLSNSLSVQRYLDPRHDVWSLLRSCQDHPDGIRALVTVVRTFHRGSRPMIELDNLVESLLPDELLTPEERAELIYLLSDVAPRHLQLACHHGGMSPWISATFDWSDFAAVVRRVEASIGRAGDAPPLLEFVDFVAHQLDPVRTVRLHRWTDRVGDRIRLKRETVRGLCLSARDRLDKALRFYFVVQLQPYGIDPNSYLMSVWLQQHLSAEEPLHRDDTPITLREVAERLPDLLEQAHAALGVGTGELTLEFILPRSLIGHPIDQWEIDRIFPHPVGTSYPVIVRSLDRLGSLGLHGTWRQKWQWLSNNGHLDDPTAVHWLLEPDSRTPNSLRARLIQHDSLVVLAMAFPPKDSAALESDELSASLYAGMPVMLWCRKNDLGPQFEQEIREILIGHGLVELPKQVLHLRQKADETDTASALGRHLTLLWDDADRIPQAFSRNKRLRAPQ